MLFGLLMVAWMPNMGFSEIKTGYGYVEKVALFPDQTLMNAKLDTGAGISSLSAKNIKHYEKSGKKYVQFDVIFALNYLGPISVSILSLLRACSVLAQPIREAVT